MLTRLALLSVYQSTVKKVQLFFTIEKSRNEQLVVTIEK